MKKSLLRNPAQIIGVIVLLVVLTGVVEYSMGRLWLGPDGHFGWWEGSIWSSEQSQRVADPYSFSHIIHGILFFGLLWFFARHLSIEYRLILAVLMEVIWEILENSPMIISRYREMTISRGYVGDSILNSISDIGMVMIGFFIARKLPVWVTVSLVVLAEIFALFWIRDNLTLNLIMLIHPIAAIKAWQSAGHIL